MSAHLIFRESRNRELAQAAALNSWPTNTATNSFAPSDAVRDKGKDVNEHDEKQIDVATEEAASALLNFLLRAAYKTIKTEGTDPLALGTAYLCAGKRLLTDFLPPDELDFMLKQLARRVPNDEQPRMN